MLKDKKKFNYNYIYGPVSSWRLGRSLGVDVLPQHRKTCTFNCIYCQLGSSPAVTKTRKEFVSTEKILEEIKNIPKGMKIDYITFSGNGEPTLAKNLGEIIRGIRRIRKDKIAVITDASLMWKKDVRKDLSPTDLVAVKIDAYSERSFRKISRPVKGIDFKDVYGGIKVFRKEYKGKFALQIMFIAQNKAHFKEIAELAYDINPDEIQINTPTRPNPVKPLSKYEIAEITDYFRKFGKKIGADTAVISLYERKRKRVSAINKEDTIKRRGAVV